MFRPAEKLFPTQSGIEINSVEALCRLAVPDHGEFPSPADFRNWSATYYKKYDRNISYENNTAVWLAEAEAAIDLDETLREASHYDAPKSLANITFFYVPILAYGLPACFLIISGRHPKPDAEFLVDVATHEIEEFIRERFTVEVIEAMAERKSLKASVALVAKAHFGWAKDFYQALDIAVKQEQIEDLTFYFPESFDDTWITNAKEKLTDLVLNTSNRIRAASIRIAESHHDQIVAAISAQSLSHNIGSHALSDARLFDVTGVSDVEGL